MANEGLTLDAAQKGHKVRNLLQALRRNQVIVRDGTKATAVWRLDDSAKHRN